MCLLFARHNLYTQGDTDRNVNLQAISHTFCGWLLVFNILCPRWSVEFILTLFLLLCGHSCLKTRILTNSTSCEAGNYIHCAAASHPLSSCAGLATLFHLTSLLSFLPPPPYLFGCCCSLLALTGLSYCYISAAGRERQTQKDIERCAGQWFREEGMTEEYRRQWQQPSTDSYCIYITLPLSPWTLGPKESKLRGRRTQKENG